MDSEDRVNYSIARKISTGNYENVTIQFGYSSSLKKGESLKDATTRVVEYVEEFIEGKETKIKEQLEDQE